METKVTIIIQEMLPLLNNAQLLALRESLERHLFSGVNYLLLLNRWRVVVQKPFVIIKGPLKTYLQA